MARRRKNSLSHSESAGAMEAMARGLELYEKGLLTEEKRLEGLRMGYTLCIALGLLPPRRCTSQTTA